MTDVQNTSADAAESRKVAEHDWLAPDGQAVDDIEAATGYRYRQVIGAGGDFAYQIPGAVAGSVQTMLALFGTKTKAINWSSQLRGTDRRMPIDVAALAGRFAEIADGQWPEREGGGGGRGYDLEKLYAAFADVMGRKKKPINETKVRGALAEGGTIGGQALDAKQYRAAIMKVDGVRTAYDRLMGNTTRLDDIADDFA